MEYAGDIIVRCDARGRVNYINEMGVRVFKLSAAHLEGRRALELIRREDRRRAIATLKHELAEGEYGSVHRGPGDRRGGHGCGWTDHPGAASLAAFSTDSRLSRGILRNAGGWKAELRSSEERFRLLYENGPVAYHEVDRQGVIRCVNRAECDLLGIPAEELVGRRVVELLIPEDRETSREAVTAKMEATSASSVHAHVPASRWASRSGGDSREPVA